MLDAITLPYKPYDRGDDVDACAIVDADCARWEVQQGRWIDLSRKSIREAAEQYQRAATLALTDPEGAEYEPEPRPDEYLNIVTSYERDGCTRIKSYASIIRQVRKSRRQAHELDQMHRRRIGGRRGQSRHASPALLDARREQVRRNRAFMRDACIVNEKGEVVRLADLPSGVRCRAAKYYAIVIGQQRYAADRKWIPLFVTCTLPPEYHPSALVGNDNWDGQLTPANGWDELMDRNAAFRKRANEARLRVFGCRVGEAHDDACPHLHMLLYFPAERVERAKQLLRNAFGSAKPVFCARDDVDACAIVDADCAQWLRLMGEVDDPACKIIEITETLPDGRKAAKPASYVMTYIFKGLSAGDNPARVVAHDAWKSAWCERSIHFWDCRGAKTIWDEARRIKLDSYVYRTCGGELRALVDAARAGDYCALLEVLDELNCDRRNPRVRIAYSVRESATAMSGVTKRVRGLLVDGRHIDLHTMRWTAPMNKTDAGYLAAMITPSSDRTITHNYSSRYTSTAATPAADAAQPPTPTGIENQISDSPSPQNPTGPTPPPASPPRPQHAPPTPPASRATARLTPQPANRGRRSLAPPATPENQGAWGRVDPLC